MGNFVNVINQFVLMKECKLNEAKGGIFVKKKNKTPAGRITCTGNGAIPVRDYAGTIQTGESSGWFANPTTDGNGVTTWDCIYFGNYYQSNSSTKEPIKWRVLSVDGNDAFLLADQNLDAKPYNEEDTDVTWATCTLRTWLNGTFLNTAFTSAEQTAIKNTTVVNEDNSYYGTEGGVNTTDKVYLLSIAEASNTAYGFNGEFNTESETREAKIRHMQKSAERRRARVRSTRGTAIGGCGRRASIVILLPLCFSMATAVAGVCRR